MAGKNAQTTPDEITDRILELASSFTDQQPVFLEITPRPESQYGFCYQNVAAAIAKEGGEPVHGWIVWEWPGVFTEAEHHCLWHTPDGDLCDITPQPDGEQCILFIPDPTSALKDAVSDKRKITKRWPYPGNDEAYKFCRLRNEIDKDKAPYEHMVNGKMEYRPTDGHLHLIDPKLRRQNRLLESLLEKHGA